MGSTALVVVSAAAGVAFLHTVLGPDHYLPFVALSRARGWSLARTLWITLLCGLAHVASSLLLGGIGLALGYSVGQVEQLETSRGHLAAWSLVAFGAAYALWGLRRVLRQRTGTVLHLHGGHVHLHRRGDVQHEHGPGAPPARDGSFWVLFTVFALGPCEPLLPLFLVPACTGSWNTAWLACVAFTLTTLATMVASVALGVAGLRRLPLDALERWMHPMTGGVLVGSGLAILYLVP